MRVSAVWTLLLVGVAGSACIASLKDEGDPDPPFQPLRPFGETAESGGDPGEAASPTATERERPAPPPPDGRLPVLRPGLERLLYVTNDLTGNLELFRIDENHRPLRTITLGGKLGRFRGISCHPGTARLFMSDSDTREVLALDLKTDAIVWRKQFDKSTCDNPDRLNVSGDGSSVYVPCKGNDDYLILDAATGAVIKTFPFADSPHNTFLGEGGRFMYATGYQNDTMQVWDTTTHTKVRDIGPFSGGIRPFAVSRDEKRVYVNLTPILGFGIGDATTGRVIGEYRHTTPAVRTANKSAQTDRPHGGEPYSHGLAVRQGHDEVWFIDDAWGYLYAFDVSTEPPRHLADIPLYTDVTAPWGHEHFRWVAFSIDGKYAYPADGSIVDADAKKLVPERIPASEKLLEVVFDSTGPLYCSGQNGGWYAR